MPEGPCFPWVPHPLPFKGAEFAVAVAVASAVIPNPA